MVKSYLMEKTGLGVTLPLTFFKEVKTELSKVVWPTRDQALKLTLVVIIISVATGIYVGGADLLLTKLMELVIK